MGPRPWIWEAYLTPEQVRPLSRLPFVRHLAAKVQFWSQLGGAGMTGGAKGDEKKG